MKPTFDALQKKLVNAWQSIGSTLAEHYEENHTVVVIPSLSVDIELSTSAQRGYEERLLFLLFLLRKPGIHIIFVTSMPVSQNIIDYFLEMLPGVISSHACKRLTLLSPEDGSARPLTKKILERPYLIQQIRDAIPDKDLAHMVPFNTTDTERELAVELGIPMYAADPRFYAFGTKSGCRRIFKMEDIQHPLGTEDLFSENDVLEAIINMRRQRPSIQKVVIKLNEGVSGLGNVLLNLNDVTPVGAENERQSLQTAMHKMDFEGKSTYDGYMANLSEYGAIVEEYISGSNYRSPSVQLRLTPHGEVELLSTHDQILGGAGGQDYLGAKFPANPEYSPIIVRDAIKIGESLARQGVLGRFAVDFVVVKNEAGEWESYAIEINLRKGGTTAPFLILQYLTDGVYDGTTGEYRTAHGQLKYYVANDHVENDAYKMFTPDKLMDIVSTHRLHYNHATQTGVVMHIMTGVGDMGRVGVTAIGDTPQQAQQLYQEFVSVLDQEARILSEITS